MSQRKICLTIAYDGTDFCGWQIQKRGERTVQEEMEKALTVMHKQPVAITAAGRTDSGVHAAGQTAHFTTTLGGIPTEKFPPALNALLPRDVRVIGAREVPEGFHARFDARQRRYKYYIKTGYPPLPWQQRYCTYNRREPELEGLNRLAAVLTGTHDFTSFCALGDPSESKIRRIDTSIFYCEREMLVYAISGNAFLWKMVRTIVGTLLRMEEEGMGRKELIQLRDAGDRTEAFATAPPRGLYLHKVVYDD